MSAINEQAAQQVADILVPVYTVEHDVDRASALNPEKARLVSWAELRTMARVPEHSIPFMAAMSGGNALVVNNYIFFTGKDWVSCIGYPLSGEYELGNFITAADIVGDFTAHAYQANLSDTERNADKSTIDMFAVAPALPDDAVTALGGTISEVDNFYILPAGARVPHALQRFVVNAAKVLRVEEGCEFTAAHRQLWSEMLTKPDMRPNVREMYAKTGRLLQSGVKGLSFLNAWDAEGKLAAALLIDASPQKFCAYIIGAHSRRNYVPHATDLLFAAMLDKARELGKEYIHLGLGVNEGILRFKKKWGGQQDLSFVMANWEHSLEPKGLKESVGALLSGFANYRPGLTKQQLFDALPKQRPFAMLWELEKNGRKSWIGGSAHFFYYSFTNHFEKLFSEVDTVIFEGPMDEESMALFNLNGQTRLSEDADIFSMLSAAELLKLKRTVEGAQEPWLRKLYADPVKPRVDVEFCLKNYRPWHSFFSLWTAFLERNGWAQSVDLEAWNLAHELGKSVIAMETHEEQIASLSSVPAERIAHFFRQCGRWPAFSRANISSYLLGNLGGMYGTSTEFPTLGVHKVFNVRDVRFTERMLPFVERGGCITFVGSAHMLGMRELLQREGVKVTKVFPSRWHKLKCELLQKIKPDNCDFT